MSQAQVGGTDGKSRPQRRFLALFFGFVLAALLLGLFFWRTDWEGFRSAFLKARVGYLAAAFSVVFMSFWLRAVRWGYLLVPLGRTALWSRLRTFMEGYTVTNLLPGRVGEVVRPWLLSRDEPHVPFSSALATVVIERILDMLTVTAFLGVYLALYAKGVEDEAFRYTLRTGAIAALASVVAGLGVLGYAFFRREAAARAMEKLFRFFPERVRTRLDAPLHRFLDGLAVFGRRKLFAPLLFGSAAMWLVIALYTWLALLSVGVNTGFSSMLLLIPVSAIGIMLPTPGGVGGYHAAAQVVLVDVCGVASGEAAAGILLAHGISYLPLSVWGVILLSKRGMGWRVLSPEVEA
ncbi:MAG: flippase-like domain-containing protein [Acidobacteriota bacterium]|nr:MAG: flippase-like domain-containing protein [Acidobacteriota bacterium]